MKRFSVRKSPVSRISAGVTLIELVITMGISGVVMATGIGTLHVLLRTDKVLVDSLQRSRTISQLSKAFRRDVHAARQVETERAADNQSPLLMILTLGREHHVGYAVKNHVLLRTETKSRATVQTERYVFSSDTKISITANQATGVSLVIRSRNPSSMGRRRSQSTAPLRELRIQAVPGRDQRYVRQE